jgi:hypothetical protein
MPAPSLTVHQGISSFKSPPSDVSAAAILARGALPTNSNAGTFTQAKLDDGEFVGVLSRQARRLTQQV